MCRHWGSPVTHNLQLAVNNGVSFLAELLTGPGAFSIMPVFSCLFILPTQGHLTLELTHVCCSDNKQFTSGLHVYVVAFLSEVSVVGFYTCISPS